MPRALFSGVVIADSDHCETVEGNQYFPRRAVVGAHLTPSEYTTYCPWKGTARYFHVIANGQTAENGAWYYERTKPAAKSIEGRIAFWNGVEVEP